MVSFIHLCALLHASHDVTLALVERLNDAARKSIVLQEIVSLRVTRERLSGCLDVVVLLIPANAQNAPWWTLAVPHQALLWLRF